MGLYINIGKFIVGDALYGILAVISPRNNELPALFQRSSFVFQY